MQQRYYCRRILLAKPWAGNYSAVPDAGDCRLHGWEFNHRAYNVHWMTDRPKLDYAPPRQRARRMRGPLSSVCWMLFWTTALPTAGYLVLLVLAKVLRNYFLP